MLSLTSACVPVTISPVARESKGESMTPTIPLLTLAETMERLRVSKSTLHRILARRELRRTRVGGRTLIRESELLRYLDRQTK